MKILSVLVLSLGLLGGISAQTRAEATPTQQAPASCCKKGKSGETASSCQGKAETTTAAAASQAPACHGKSETASSSCCKGKSEAAAAPARENRRNRQQKAAAAARTEQP